MGRQAELANPSRERHTSSQFWILAACLPICLCAARLNADLWHDEAYTLVNFASHPVARIVTDYSAPNNHILYTIILHATYLISDQEFVLRLPGLGFAIGCLICAFLAGKFWAGLLGGVAATVWLGLTQMFLIHVMELRGYGLSLLLAAILALLALPRESGHKNPMTFRRVGAFLASWAIVYTIPTNLLVVIPLGGLVLFWEGRAAPAGLVRGQSPWWVAGTCAGVLSYLPVREQLRQAASGTGWDVVANARLLVDFFRAACYDWWPAIGLAMALLAISGLIQLWEKSRQSSAHVGPCLENFKCKSGHFLAWALAGTLGPFIVAAALGVRPFVRNFFPCLFFLATGCGVIFAQAVNKIARLSAQAKLRLRNEGNLATMPPRAGEKSASGPGLDQSQEENWQVALATGFVLTLLVLPQLLTYPDRLAERRRRERVQDGYYNFYAARYGPRTTVQALYRFANAFGKGRNVRVIFPPLEYYPLAYYLAREHPRDIGWDPQAKEEVLFLIVPEYQAAEEVLKTHEITLGDAEAIEFLGDFGFYQLYWVLKKRDKALDTRDPVEPLRVRGLLMKLGVDQKNSLLSARHLANPLTPPSYHGKLRALPCGTVARPTTAENHTGRSMFLLL
ncbi:MAG: hypothetical protein NZ899_08170 [Thermoguttaceae bacterium]|nr:hypothetical protein [Thermoguttaceae bacterium]MDW8078079.1 hypothetical protein [Thermoguttaceae bacterium]